MSFTDDVKPALPTPTDLPSAFDFSERVSGSSRPLDLDGMNIMGDIETPSAQDPNFSMHMELEPVAESPEEEVEQLPWGNDPATSSWAPLMAEVKTTP